MTGVAELKVVKLARQISMVNSYEQLMKFVGARSPVPPGSTAYMSYDSVVTSHNTDAGLQL